MSSKQGGKAKPLKAPKAQDKDYDEVDMANMQKKKEEEKGRQTCSLAGSRVGACTDTAFLEMKAAATTSYTQNEKVEYDKIVPPRIEDAGLEDCALPEDLINQAFYKAFSARASQEENDNPAPCAANDEQEKAKENDVKDDEKKNTIS